MPGQKTAILQLQGTITDTSDWPTDSRGLRFCQPSMISNVHVAQHLSVWSYLP